jgi:hypothetical protein
LLLEELVFWHYPTKIGVLQILMLSLLGLFEDEPHSFGLARFKREWYIAESVRRTQCEILGPDHRHAKWAAAVLDAFAEFA